MRPLKRPMFKYGGDVKRQKSTAGAIERIITTR